MTLSLITGGSRGLGRNTALSIARGGGDVAITYRSNAAQAEKVVAEIQAIGRKAAAFRLDSGEVSAFPAFVDVLGAALQGTFGRDRIDHIVHNAGHGEFALIADTTPAQFDGLVNVHFKGPFFLTQALLPLIADGGRIVNIGTGLTRVSYPGFAAYAAAKAASDMMTVYMAKEFGPRGIAVNTVAPGAIETDFGGGLVRDTPDVNKQFADLTALGRVGVPDDIGPMIASLLTESNRWVNAQRIEVSGGQSI